MAIGFDWTDKVNNKDFVMAEDVNILAEQIRIIGNMVDALIPRVGQIYMTTENVNPGTYMPGTTWVAWGEGRVPVGVDTWQTEFNTVGKIGGAKTHNLSEEEIANHRHAGLYGNYHADRIFTTRADGGGGPNKIVYPSSVSTQDGSSSTIVTGYAGGGQAHNNLQPYITCYMWRRTA